MLRTLWSCAVLVTAFACAKAPQPVVAPAAPATCPPAVTLPAEWTACAADTDCALAGDGCRTCANHLPVNKAHLAEASARDAEARKAINCVLTCEACSPALTKLTCEGGQCRARPAAP